MNPKASHYLHAARLWVTCCLVAGLACALPAASSATSLAAAHAPDGTIHVALTQSDSGSVVAVSRSVGLMEGANGSTIQAGLGYAPMAVSRSVGLMEGTPGPEAQADLGAAPTIVTRSVGLMQGAPS